MTELTRNDLDSHDWTARASEALIPQKSCHPDRCNPVRKAEQLRVAAEMKKLLMSEEPKGVPKVAG